MLRHHAAAGARFPKWICGVLWRELLGLELDTDVAPLVEVIEAAWHPARLMPGADEIIQQLARAGVSLGVLSNAQFTSLRSLGGTADLFAPELTILSYQHGIAKPSPELFEMLADRLAGRGISPDETLFIGNDPLQDIVPAAAHGFKTALFTGHPDSLRPGECTPDFVISRWSGLTDLGSLKMHGEWRAKRSERAIPVASSPCDFGEACDSGGGHRMCHLYATTGSVRWWRFFSGRFSEPVLRVIDEPIFQPLRAPTGFSAGK